MQRLNLNTRQVRNIRITFDTSRHGKPTLSLGRKPHFADGLSLPKDITLGDRFWVAEAFIADTHGLNARWEDYDTLTKRCISTGTFYDREGGLKQGMYWKCPPSKMKLGLHRFELVAVDITEQAVTFDIFPRPREL